MVFTVSTRNYIGNHETIVRHDEKGNEIPVLHIIPGEIDFPGDKKALAANIASLLNGNDPLHDVDIGPNRIFWKKNENGYELRILEDSDYAH